VSFVYVCRKARRSTRLDIASDASISCHSRSYCYACHTRIGLEQVPSGCEFRKKYPGAKEFERNQSGFLYVMALLLSC